MDPQNSGANQPSAPQNPGQNNAGEIALGICAYLGILVIIPFIVRKDDPFIKFHIKQGLVLLVGSILVWIVGMIAWQLWVILNIVNLAIFILAILGIINVVKHQEKELPLVGQFARYFKF